MDFGTGRRGGRKRCARFIFMMYTYKIAKGGSGWASGVKAGLSERSFRVAELKNEHAAMS
jgi:hypothetical protein